MKTLIPSLGNRVIGLDQLSDLMDRMVNESPAAYPPHNIEKKDENTYELSLAVAGFAPDNLEIEVEGESLKVTGKIDEDAETQKTFLHKGIAQRGFVRKFHLAPHMKVTGASSVNGLLTIQIEREIPEAMKPRKISVTTQ